MPTTPKKTTPKKTPAKTTRSRSSTTPKKTTPRKKRTTKKDTTPTMNKEQLVSGLQQTMKDVGRLPGILLAPVIAYVSSKYDSIPESRRKRLEEIVKSSKEQGGSVLSKIKDRFMSRFEDAKETVTQDTDKRPNRKRTPRKKPSTRTSTTKKTPTKKTTRKSTPSTTKKTPTKRAPRTTKKTSE